MCFTTIKVCAQQSITQFACVVVTPPNFIIDTIIKNEIYESYFCYFNHNPQYVKYKLYHGGGECNRSKEGFTFHIEHGGTANNNYIIPINSATPKDYSYSGFDEGHMANAEDFAYDCKKEALTFKFYNCIPQYPNLNRGIWKHYETIVRALSQNDSLLILCGGTFSNNKMTNTQVTIPINCWKLVKSLSTGQILFCQWYTNMPTNNSVQDITPQELQKRIIYKINY